MKKIKQSVTASRSLVAGLVIAGAVAGATLPAQSATALDPGRAVSDGVSDAGGNGGSGTQDLGRQVRNVVNVLLFLLGTVAVVMIIIGGIRYTTSNGDQAQLTAAKNTILYSVIGLVVAILAFAIVNFVVDAFSRAGGGGGGSAQGNE